MFMMQKNFWKNKKVLITGHTGFKGAWLSNILLYFGANVYGYSLKPDKNCDLYNITKLKKKLNSEFLGDILNFKKFKNFAITTKPEIIFHLAAQPLVRKSFIDPFKTYETNSLGTLNVLEVSRFVPSLKSLLVITTDKVYKNEENKKSFLEDDILGGDDPYSSSKAIAELMCQSYSLNYFNKKNKAFIATVRAGNVLGGGDWGKDRLIPDLIKNLLQNRFTVIRSPNSVRPWQHVFDVLNSYLIIAESLFKKNKIALGSWNIGPGGNTFYTVSDIVNKFKKFIPDLKFRKKNKLKNNLKELNFLRLNNKKFKKTFGFSNKMNIYKIIKATSDWYNHYIYKRSSIRDYTLKQIKEYFG